MNRRPIAAPRRVVVLKPCCLGDLLLATPAIAAIKDRWPHARIAVATSAWSRPAIANNPCVDSVIECEATARRGWRSLVAALRLAAAFRNARFDVAVVLDRSPVMSAVPMLAGIPVRAGIDSDGRGFSLTHRAVPEPRQHEATLYLDVVAALGCPGTPSLRFQPTPEEEQWAAAAVPPGIWVALHPAGGANPGGRLLGKRWPRDRFGELAQRLLRRGVSVMLLGGADDYGTTQEIAANLEPAQRQRVYDFAGRSSFGQTAALLSRCSLFVGNDTGSMHLAAAMGTPVLAIFGPSRPEVYGPVAERCTVVHHGDRCGSCRFEGGIAQHCVNSFACIAAVSVDEVEQAAVSLLSPA